MMANLNTIVQLFATIYITISVDIQFCQRFWSQGYYHTVTKNIAKYRFLNSSKLQNEFKQQIKERADKLKTASRIKGTYMFLFCLSILLFTAFETQDTKYQIQVSFCTICSSIIMFFSYWLLKKWHYMLVASLVSFLILFIPYQNSIIELYPNLSKIFSTTFTKIIIIIILVLPVISQLFSNWLHSVIYQKYLIETLNKVVDDYQAALEVMYSGNAEKCPQAYKDVFASIGIKKITGMDLQLTEVNKNLNKNLIMACKQPQIKVLWKYIWKEQNEIKQIPQSDIKKLSDANTSVVEIKKSEKALIPNSSSLMTENKGKNNEYCKVLKNKRSKTPKNNGRKLSKQ